MNAEPWWKANREREAAYDLIVRPVREGFASQIAEAYGIAKVWSGHFGATGIDPKHLLVYFVAPTRDDINRIKCSPQWSGLQEQLRARLASGGFPTDDLSSTWLGLFSEQQCQEEANGNWYHFFK